MENPTPPLRRSPRGGWTYDEPYSWHPGQKVRIIAGPFAGQTGVLSQVAFETPTGTSLPFSHGYRLLGVGDKAWVMVRWDWIEPDERGGWA